MIPREFHHRGRVEASGLLLSSMERVLASWRPGVTVRRVDGGWVVVLPEVASIRVDASPGLPLVRSTGRLAGLPLAPDELLGGYDHVLVARAGQLVDLGRGEPVEVHEQVALPGVEVEAFGLVAPAVAPVPVAVPVEPEQVFMETIGPRDPLPEGSGAMPSANLWMRAIEGLRRLLGTRRELGTRRKRAAPGEVGPGGTARRALSSSRSTSSAGSEVPSSWRQRLDHWLAQRASRLGLLRSLARSHARYLQSLLERFEGGDIDEEALRRAIPLGGDGPSGAASLAGWLRQARESLSFTSGGSPGRAVLSFEQEVRDRLEAAYQRAAVSLERQGRIEQAAYVLGELLHRPLEAVALLEKHEMYALAADLAEAKTQDHGLMVRLNIQAGRMDRAESLARRHGAFASAVAQLERLEEHALASRWRFLWAMRLAKVGAFRAAITTLLPEHRSREGVQEWIASAIRAGGPGAGETLVELLDAEPSRFDELRPVAQSVLDEPTHDGSLAMLRAIERASHRSDALRALTVAALRRVRCSPNAAQSRPFRRVADKLRESVPLQDLDRPQTSRGARTIGASWTADGHDRGRTEVVDAVVLSDGRILLAHGEAGVSVRDPDGGAVRRWDVPCHALVPHHHGTQVLLVTRRGRLGLVQVLSLDTEACTPWADVQVDHFARCCNDVWFVAMGSRLHAVNRARNDWRSTWSVDLGRAILSMAVDAERLAVSTDEEVFCYSHGRSISLRIRRDPVAEGSVFDPDGCSSPVSEPVAVGEGDTHQPHAAQRTIDGVVAVCAGPLVHVRKEKQGFLWNFRGATRTVVRVDGDVLIAADELGRVRVVRLDGGTLYADLRV